jgi:succinyldiaminopimelate transaminase
MAATGGFIPPPYPYERLDALKHVADSLAGGVVDCSIGTPCDPVPEVASRAATDALAASNGYPPSAGTAALREAAAGWIRRRFGVAVESDHVGACVGTKELVASLPHLLRLRNPTRDTVLFPAIAYPSYEMGAVLAGCRAVPVALDADWHLDIDSISDSDAQRALVLWVNEPGNPSASTADDAYFARVAAWARARGVVIASDECYSEFAPRPATILSSGLDGVLAMHSVSKRSNLAGMRVGFYAGDPELVTFLVETRKHAGLMAPTMVQAAAAAALGDDAHVDVQRARYAERGEFVRDALAAHGLVHDGGDAAFYLWMRTADGADDGWEIAAKLAHDAGLLVSPGDLYGAAGADHVRVALVQPRERLELALQRMNIVTGASWTPSQSR